MVEALSERDQQRVPCPRCGKQFRRHDMMHHLQSRHERRQRDVSGDCRMCNDIAAGAMMPPHDASPRCESGWHSHCTCDTCF